MTKRRILSIILVICIILSFTVPVCAENENAEVGNSTENEIITLTAKQEEALSAMRALGFVSEEYTEDVIAELGAITRGKFAEFANKLYFRGVEPDSLYFHDVPRTYYAFAHISSLVENGVIAINDEKLFRPNDVITPNEAAKIIIYSLGYGKICDFSDDSFAASVKLAQDMKIFDGVSQGKTELSFYDMLVMVYNSLTVKIPEMSDLKLGETETYLSRYYDIYVDKGRVNGVDGISVFGDAVKEDEVLIDSEKYETGILDMIPYLAKNILFFYKGEDKKVLLWVKELGNNEETVIKRDNFPEFSSSDRTVRYTVNGRTKKAKISDSVDVIYNGAHVTAGVDAVLSKEFYQMRLLKINSSDYDVCIVDSYENCVVASNNYEEEQLYVKYKNFISENYEYKSIDLSAYDVIEIILPDGTKGIQREIPANCVISVFESADNHSRIRIVCSLSSVRGNLSRINNDEANQIICLDDAEYMSYSKNLKFDFSPGSNVEIKLDAYGFIAEIEISSGTVKFGFMIRRKVARRDEMVKVWVFDSSSGEIVELNCAKKVKIDGTMYRETDEIYMAISAEPQLIAFSLNDNGEIKMIDMAEPESSSTVRTADNMLVKMNSFASLKYSSYARTFGPKIRVGGSTTFISVPKNPSQNSILEDFGVGSVSYFSNESDYDVEAYQYGIEERKEFCDILLCNSVYFYSEYWVSTGFLVDKVATVYDENSDEAVCQISGYHGSTYKTLQCTPAVTQKIQNGTYSVKKGDMLSVTNQTGHIDDFKVSYGPSATSRPTSDFKLNLGRETCFYPNEIQGTTIFGGIYSKDFEEIFTTGNATVFVYDFASDELRQGTLADIRTYKVYGDACSTVYYYSVSGEVRNFVIYNN